MASSDCKEPWTVTSHTQPGPVRSGAVYEDSLGTVVRVDSIDGHLVYYAPLLTGVRAALLRQTPMNGSRMTHVDNFKQQFKLVAKSEEDWRKLQFA